MARRILHAGPDGAMTVTVLAPGAALDEALRRLGLRGGDHLLVEEGQAPPADFGLGAWTRQGSRAVLDMAAARAAHLAAIRRARDAALAQADVEWMKAMDAGDTARAQAVGRERQRLRDIPQRFSLAGAGSAAELLALWPEGLPRPG